MKRKNIFFILLFIVIQFSVFASEPFRFALFTDLHISSTNPTPSEDLTNAVNDVNALTGIDFVIVSGDVSESGDGKSLQAAKAMLDKLKIPYYITAGNHETKWSESGFTDFARIFGNDKFSFTHKGCKFIGFTTGPIIKMGDGHIAPQDIDWVDVELKKAGIEIPVFVVTHYPLQAGDVDNWYDMTDVLRKYNVQTLLNGHYHRNVFLNYDGIPGVVNRSTLRAKNKIGGYTIYSVSDSIRVYEKKIGQPEINWLTFSFESRNYNKPNPALRPSFEINKENKNVSEVWRLNSRVGIYGKPAVANELVYYGDDFGYLNAVSLIDGTPVWKFKTGSRIISSPAVMDNKVVVGSTDGNIYCLNSLTGKQLWKYETTKAVMGCPLIQHDTVFIGGSDGCFRALNLKNGTQFWQFAELKNYEESLPVIATDKIYFGAWDTYFYALERKSGKLAWKWNNGNAGILFSPAAVTAIVSNGKVFITAPDRYWTALNAQNGTVVWRTNKHEVRETEGISEDGNTVYSRCMNDSVVALDARSDKPVVLWKKSAAYGYDHNPSMLTNKDGVIVFGTRNGLLIGIDTASGSVLWKYKIGNSIINTVTILPNKECILTTSEGVVARIKY
ncbi:MAG: PQQ-binding-like beta-propeller repeat protein [Paludibacter sp.]|nr:PQQ-binding-like beta-propeller repeat protein [Paludibacter sp.]